MEVMGLSSRDNICFHDVYVPENDGCLFGRKCSEAKKDKKRHSFMHGVQAQEGQVLDAQIATTNSVSRFDVLETDGHSVFDQRISKDVTSQSPVSNRFSASVSATPAVSSNTRYQQTDEISRRSKPADTAPTPVSNDGSVGELQTWPNVRQTILNALPTEKDIQILLGRVKSISAIHYHASYMCTAATPNEISFQQRSRKSLLQPESHPVLLARQMLLFAAELQYFSPNETIPGLSKPHHVIMEELAEAAIRHVTTNDALLGTLEAYENLILEAFFHIDQGNIRRAWITLRRAVMVAQLLGLHTSGPYRYKVIDDRNVLDPKAMFNCVLTMERVLSLLLGLPTSTMGSDLATQGTSTVYSEDVLRLTILLGSVPGKILERNRIESAKEALECTAAIDRELIQIAGRMPSDFWQPPAFVGLVRDSLEAFDETRRIFDHMCYYTLLIQLHLPHMLSPGDASQRDYSQVACVNASREILAREIALRTFNVITACCRMADFLALIAGMTLMLAHAVSHCDRGTKNMLAHQRLGDRATVQRALECMKSMSELHEDVLAVKCAALLKDLLAVEEDAAHQQNQPQSADGHTGRSITILRVPYIGTISISRDGIAAVTPTKTGDTEDLHDGVTIGGIGLICVNTPESLEDRTSRPTPNMTALQGADNSSVHLAPYQQAVTTGELRINDDQMFPDAAAGLDDWAFQGLDTAFFDVLMRGAGDHGVSSSWDTQTVLPGATARRWESSTFT